MRNRRYVGVHEFGEWTNETAWEPIVDRGVFEKAQEILASQVRAVRSPRSDDYVYLLRELIWCPHCGCRYTPSVAKGGAVRYYECLHAKKKLSNCPVARVNCEALHRTILAELARHAEHQTVMHQAIAESHAWSEPEQEKVALRAALAEQRRQLSIKQSNLLKAIENGQVIQTLLDRLQELEQEIKVLDAKILEADELIARSTAKRPTAAQVQSVWASALCLWEQADDDQKQTILRGLVQRVEMRDKDRAVVSISPFFCSEPLGFGTTEKMGAGVGFEPTTSGL
ncbi:MAG: recombinase zinc beta ribbon domain-containing protein [Armatimonadetes bacterium]|nr:recombinase zinc beta ribbon domain-containing protein [Armatimonadota bacterium]